MTIHFANSSAFETAGTVVAPLRTVTGGFFVSSARQGCRAEETLTEQGEGPLETDPPGAQQHNAAIQPVKPTLGMPHNISGDRASETDWTDASKPRP